MTEPVQEEAARVARGRSWTTPFVALGGVAAVVAVAVAFVTAIALLIWLVL